MRYLVGCVCEKTFPTAVILHQSSLGYTLRFQFENVPLALIAT